MSGGARPRESSVDRIRQRVEEKAVRRAEARAAARRPPAGDPDVPPAGSPTPEELPGIDAASPTQIPWRGWKQIVRRAWAENNADNMPTIAGGVAFFGFLAVFPALIALISIYGLVVSPDEAARQVEELTTGLPDSARDLIADQVTAVTENTGGALSLGLLVSIVAALWSASGGVNNLVKAVNIAYDEVETRNVVKLRALSLALTLGAIVFVVLTIGLVAVLPVVLDALPLGAVGTVLAEIGRWVALLAVVAGSLAILYRIAPDRDAPRFRWVSLGSIVVTLAWAVVSLGFTVYVNNFGSYNKTYGAIAGVIVLMLWLYLTCYLILLGAEINAEAEHQTAVDTTDGAPQPMGVRGAVKADTLPEKPEPGEGDGDPTRRNAGGSAHV
jgi:YihY family inner membrane protein